MLKDQKLLFTVRINTAMRFDLLRNLSIWIICIFSGFVHSNDVFRSSGSQWSSSKEADFYGVDASLLQHEDFQLPSEGIMQIAVPTIGDDEVYLRPICYPKPTLEAYRQFSYLSHASCRQLGFMTYAAWGETHLDDSADEQPLMPVQPSGFICQGYEQSLSQCRWRASPTDACTQVATVKCHSCHKTIEDNEGFIVSPGYPYAYFYTLLCEWDIELSKDHRLELTFKKLDLPLGRHTRCEEDTAHLEVIFATSASRNFRFCAIQTVNKLKIEDHQGKITIRFYSGIYFHTSTKGNYGFSITYKVEKMPHWSQIVKAIIISSGFVVFFVIVGFCYACQRCFPGSNKKGNKNLSEPETHDQCSVTQKQKSEMFLKPPSTGGGGYSLGSDTLDWSHKQQPDKPSPDSCVSSENYSAMITPTERVGIPVPGTYNMEQSKRFCRSKLRTILLSKFTPQSSESKSSSTVPKYKPSTLGFQIYRSVSSISDVEDVSCCAVKNHSGTDMKFGYNDGSPGYNGSYIPPSPKQSPLSPANLPTIVVECMDTKEV